MDKYRVKCIFGKISSEKLIKVKVPGSKSITNRALLIAALASLVGHFFQMTQKT